MCPPWMLVNAPQWLITAPNDSGRCHAALNAAIPPLLPTGELAFAGLLLNLVSLAMISAAAPTALLNITPGEIRGQTTAIYFLVISVAGLLLGPMTVGLLNDLVMGEAGLRYSVALIPIIFGIPVLFLMRWALRSYREEL